MVKVDLSGAKEFFGTVGPDYSTIAEAHRKLFEHTGEGSEYTGWMDLPSRVLSNELKSIQAIAAKIKQLFTWALAIGLL